MTCNAFSIKKINILSSWVFNLPTNTECTICRCNLNSPSLYNQEKGLESYVVSGLCQHSYHNECIKPWVDKNKLCPICFQKWKMVPLNNVVKNYNDTIKDINNIIKLKELDIVNNAKNIVCNIDDLLNKTTLKISHLDKHNNLKDDISDDELPDLISSVHENIFTKKNINYIKADHLNYNTGPTGSNINNLTSPKITTTDNAWTKSRKTINIIPPDSSKEINKITKEK
jgi:hypothetical protein